MNKDNKISQIKWWHQSDFWQEFDSSYKAKGIYINAYAQFEAPLQDIELLAKLPSTPHPGEEEDFAGPVERWYCSWQSHLFIITVYLGSPSYVRLAFEENAEVQNKIVSIFEEKGYDVWSKKI